MAQGQAKNPMETIYLFGIYSFSSTWQRARPRTLSRQFIYVGTLSTIFYLGIFWNLFLIMIDSIGIPSYSSYTASRRSTLGPLFLSNCTLWDSVPNGSLQCVCVRVCVCACVCVCIGQPENNYLRPGAVKSSLGIWHTTLLLNCRRSRLNNRSCLL